MRGHLASAVLVACLATALPATAQQVSYDYDKAFDFSGAKTYRWEEGTPVADAFNHQRIVAAIAAELAAKGLREAGEGETAALAVAYHASFDKDLRVTGFSSGFGGYRWGAARSGTAVVDEIVVGTIVVDIGSAAEGKLVWRGIVSKEVDVQASPEKREKSIKKAAGKVFKNFPPPAKK